jgi:hypothetical protein
MRFSARPAAPNAPEAPLSATTIEIANAKETAPPEADTILSITLRMASWVASSAPWRAK